MFLLFFFIEDCMRRENAWTQSNSSNYLNYFFYIYYKGNHTWSNIAIHLGMDVGKYLHD